MRSPDTHDELTRMALTAFAALAGLALLSACSREMSRETAGAATSPVVADSTARTGTAPPVLAVAPDADGSAAHAPVSSDPAARDSARVTPAAAKAAWHEGVALFEDHSYAAACVPLRIAAGGRPDDAYAQYLLGLALLKSGSAAEAESYLARASALDPMFVRAWTNLARARMAQANPEGALAAADAALEADPSFAAAMHQRGRALAALGRIEEAIGTLAQARALDPDDAWIANTAGYLLLRAGRESDAIPHLEAAREGLPSVAYVRNNLALAYERMGRAEEALAEFRAAIEAGDPDGKAEASLARLEGRTPLPQAPPAEATVAAGPSPQPAARAVEGDGTAIAPHGSDR